MKSLFSFVGGALLTFLALGWYFEWYTISKKPGSEPGRTAVTIDLNTKKIGDDTSRAGKAVGEKINDTLDSLPKKQ